MEPGSKGVMMVTDDALKALADHAAKSVPRQFKDEHVPTLVTVAEVFGEANRLDRAEEWFARQEFWMTVRKFFGSQIKVIGSVVVTFAVLAQFKDQTWMVVNALSRAAKALFGGS